MARRPAILPEKSLNEVRRPIPGPPSQPLAVALPVEVAEGQDVEPLAPPVLVAVPALVEAPTTDAKTAVDGSPSAEGVTVGDATTDASTAVAPAKAPATVGVAGGDAPTTSAVTDTEAATVEQPEGADTTAEQPRDAGSEVEAPAGAEAAPEFDRGFVGRVAPDGFRLPRLGEDGALTSAGEGTKAATIRVHADLFAAFHGACLRESSVVGDRVDAQRLLDAALSYVPEALDEVAEFVKGVPEMFRASGPARLGNMVRGSVHTALSDLPRRFKASGRKAVSVEAVYRAAVYRYLVRYEERAGVGLLDEGARRLKP